MFYAYPELVAEMAKRRVTRTELARGIGISTRALYAKLTGETDFTLSEAAAIHAQFFPMLNKDTLFCPSKEAPKCTTT